MSKSRHIRPEMAGNGAFAAGMEPLYSFWSRYPGCDRVRTCVQEWNQPDMPDSTARPGPPAPDRTDRTPPRGPYGLPFPRPSVNPPRRNRPEAPRQAVLVPQSSGEPAASHEAPERRPGPVPTSTAPTLAASDDLPGIVRIAFVIALVIGSLWADRGQPEPVAGYGAIPQPGAAEAVPLSVLVVGAEGEVVQLASLRGAPTVLHFWTTWLLSRAADVSAMHYLSERYDDVHGLGIDADGTIASIQAGAVSTDTIREQVDALVAGQ